MKDETDPTSHLIPSNFPSKSPPYFLTVYKLQGSSGGLFELGSSAGVLQRKCRSGKVELKFIKCSSSTIFPQRTKVYLVV